MRARAIVAGGLLLIALAPTPGQPAAMLQPLTVGWERYFTLDWQAGERHGQAVVYGHIFNNAGFTAANVRLLVEGLDDKGQVLSQSIGWLGTQLTAGTTAPFEVPAAARASTYRVSVFAFDWLQRGKGVR